MACTDQELVDRCLQGDEEAWSALSDLIQRLIGALAATRWLDAGAQEDIAQEVLAQLLEDQCRALRRFAGRSRLSTYLGAIVVRVARLRPDPHPVVTDLEELPYPNGVAAGEEFPAELWETVQQTLPTTDALVLRLDAEGYTSEEIAMLLSRPSNQPWTAAAVRQRKSRALRRLRHVLSESSSNSANS